MTTFADLSRDTVLAICDHLGGDGHGLYEPSFLTKLGVPLEVTAGCLQTYTSDGSHKGSIFDKDGTIIVEMTAVYSLSLYRRIANDLGLPGSSCMGRGFEARDLDERIREHFKD